MFTVSQLVEDIIKNSPILSEAIEEGFANYSEIARKIQPEIEKKLYKEVTIGSIVMALKRLEIASPDNKLSVTLSKITDLSMRSNLVDLTYVNSPSLFQNQAQLLDIASKTSNSFLTISHGIYETTIFISNNLLKQAEKIFKNERLKLKESGLCSITLITPEEGINTPGVHYAIFKKLYSNGINIVETATSFTELTVFLRSEDTERAFGVLKKLN